MIEMRMGFLIISIIMTLVIIPTFAISSSSQLNNTTQSDLSSATQLLNSSISDEFDDDTPIENETSFASLSRSLAETNQTDDEQTTPPPNTESESDDEQTTPPPTTESESDGETSEDDIQ
jgi:hypothetical protein